MNEQDKEQEGKNKLFDVTTPELTPFTFATSFAELEQEESTKKVADLNKMFLLLTENIMMSGNIEDKTIAINNLLMEFNERVSEIISKERVQPLTDFVKNIMADLTKAEMKTEDGIKYSAGDFAYVPDKKKPSTWKLRLSEKEPGNITISQLGRAASAFSPGGFRGQKVQIPDSNIAGVKRRIRDEYRKLGVERSEMPTSIKQADNSFAIKEMDNGDYRWTAIYSNKFRDNDAIPEIISDSSHRHFADTVDKGEVDYPELWYWHNKNWKIGKSDYVAYDDRGFSIASGLFDDANVAKTMQKHPSLCDGVSHGMPLEFIERDEKDTTIITKHITVEISPLPLAAAANKLTTFNILNEVKEMAVTQEKREAAKKLGIEIEQVEQAAESKAQIADELQIESKEKKAEQETHEIKDDVTKEDLEELVAAIGQTVGALTQTVESLASEVKELKKSDGEKIKEQVVNTPAASLGAIWQSAIGANIAKIDGRTKEAKDGPKEQPLETSDQVPGILGQIAKVNQQKINEVQ